MICWPASPLTLTFSFSGKSGNVLTRRSQYLATFLCQAGDKMCAQCEKCMDRVGETKVGFVTHFSRTQGGLTKPMKWCIRHRRPSATSPRMSSCSAVCAILADSGAKCPL